MEASRSFFLVNIVMIVRDYSVRMLNVSDVSNGFLPCLKNLQLQPQDQTSVKKRGRSLSLLIHPFERVFFLLIRDQSA